MAKSEKRSAAMRRRWADPEFRARVSASIRKTYAELWRDASPEGEARRQKLRNKLFRSVEKFRNDPSPEGEAKRQEARRKWREAMKKRLAEPEVRARISAASISHWLSLSPEERQQRRARHSAAMQRRLADPDVAAKYAENMRKAQKRRWTRPVEVPAWAADFSHEYLEHARAHGEEAAASHIRKLKRGLQ